MLARGWARALCFLMKTPCFLLSAVIALAALVVSAEELPPTFLTLRGKELRRESLGSLPALSTDKPKGFASGFAGWRFSTASNGGKSGRWELADAAFHGIESATASHPATASFGLPYQDAVIQIDVRLNDVPAEGRKYRSIFVKAPDEKDYVTAFFVSPTGSNLTAYSAERISPVTKQREKDAPVGVPQALKLGEWYTVVLEIRGDEAVGTLAGKSVWSKHPLFAKPKCSVMLGVGVDASFRNFRIWEALPNPEWAKNKESILATLPPAKK